MIVIGAMAPGAVAQLTGLTIDTPCVPGGTTAQATLTVAPCRPSIACCQQFPGCQFVTVSLTSSNPLLAQVPAEVEVDRRIGTATFGITTSPPLICFPTPCPVGAATITASDGSPPNSQGIVNIWQPSAYVDSFQLDPPTVLGGTISLARVTLQCPAPPGGWGIQISSDSSLAQPVTGSFRVPAGDDTAVLEVTTVPVDRLMQAHIAITAAGASRTATLTILPGSLDLTIRKIEITQGSQYLDDGANPDNSLPLVRGKPTAVRAYLESNTSLPIANVPVSLASRPCGTTTWTEHPALWPYATVAPVDPNDPAASYRKQRETPNATSPDHLNVTFLVDPAPLEVGCLDFVAEVNPDHVIVEENFQNNAVLYSGIDFHSAGNLNVKFVRINWCPGCPFDDTPRHKPSWTSIDPIVAYLQKVYPVNRVNFWRASKEVSVTSLTPHDFEKDAAWGYVLGALATLQAFTDDAPRTVYYGLLDRQVPHGYCGMAWLPPFPRVSMGVATPSAACSTPDATAAQEIGHNVGRLHAPCGNPADVDPGWPNSTLPNGIIGQTGFDVDTHRALPGAIYRDFMSYCGPEWISPYTYTALYGAFQGGLAAPVQTAQGQPVDHVMIRGVIDEIGNVTVANSYHADFPSGSHDELGTGVYSIVLRAADGSALVTRRFTPDLTHADAGRAFFEIMPYHPDTVQIDIMVPGVNGDEVAETCDVTAHTPQIEVSTPNGGETFGSEGVLPIRWTGSDPDGDALTYAVLYSRDAGASWEALSVDVVGTGFEGDLGELSGSENALVRVVASDGVNSAQDDSDAVFGVKSKSPYAVILRPLDRLHTALESPIVLRGAATDPEDGPLPDAEFAWRSNRDGMLGSGTSVVATLSPGVHRISLAVHDSDGNIDDPTISVSVGVVGDCDADGQIDVSDIHVAIGCLAGPVDGTLPPSCACADVDGDLDVDLFDFTFIQAAFSSILN